MFERLFSLAESVVGALFIVAIVIYVGGYIIKFIIEAVSFNSSPTSKPRYKSSRRPDGYRLMNEEDYIFGCSTCDHSICLDRDNTQNGPRYCSKYDTDVRGDCTCDQYDSILFH